MIDIDYLESSFDGPVAEIPVDVLELLTREVQEVREAIYAIECEKEHCEDCFEPQVDGSRAKSEVREKLAKIRMGVYDEERHGDLRATLEELEGLL